MLTLHELQEFEISELIRKANAFKFMRHMFLFAYIFIQWKKLCLEKDTVDFYKDWQICFFSKSTGNVMGLF